MPFQWLEMRIEEEKDRRQREAKTLAKLPQALTELHDELTKCVRNYTEAFGPESADIQLHTSKIRIVVRAEEEGKQEVKAQVTVTAVPKLPGFHIERDETAPLDIQVGLLPGENLFYRDQDEYINIEELCRRILERALFPKLAE
jgi:hypothetical protein